jgi:hypothetical protein
MGLVSHPLLWSKLLQFACTAVSVVVHYGQSHRRLLRGRRHKLRTPRIRSMPWCP